MSILRFRCLAAVIALAAFLFPLSVSSAPVAVDSEWTDLSKTLGEARMLRFRRAVVSRSYSVSQAQQLRQKQFQKIVLGENTEAREVLLQTLGLWPKNSNLETTLKDLVPNLELDWYDTENHSLVVVPGSQNLSIGDMVGLGGKYNLLLSSLGLDVNKIYRTYLLEHALLDQWFDLERLYAQTEGNMDRMLALTALCEGDALLTTITAITESLGMSPKSFVRASSSMSARDIYSRLEERFPALSTVPPVFREYVSTVLLEGLKFASTVKERGGWGALNRVLREGPLSSKQILHPVQYLNGAKMMVTVDIEAPNQVENLKRNGADCAGEFLICCWAKNKLGEAKGTALGCGWLGDRWIAYRGEDKSQALLWASVWENGEGAQRFAEFAQTQGAQVRVDEDSHTVLAAFAADERVTRALMDSKVKVNI